MTAERSRQRTILTVAIAAAVVVAAAAAVYLTRFRNAGQPSSNSEAYEQTTRHFYRGLAGLQVGLIDSARQELAQATSLAPGEPAAWANLGLAHLRLGDVESAAPPIERAADLAPESSDIAFLRARLRRPAGAAIKASPTCAARSSSTPEACARAPP